MHKNTKSRKSNKRSGALLKQVFVPPTEIPIEQTVFDVSTFNDVWSRVRGQQNTYTMVGTYESPAASDTSGNLTQVFGNNPSSVAGWSSLLGTFDEYRVLGMRLQFLPLELNGALVVQAPIAACVDYDSLTPATSYVYLAQYDSYYEASQDKADKWHKYALMSGVENAGFTTTSSPVNTFWIKTFSSGNTPSVNLGRWVLTYLIQFRGRGI